MRFLKKFVFMITCVFTLGALLLPVKPLCAQRLYSQTMVKIVDFETVKSLKDNGTVLLVDVREPSELKETGAIPSSINIPVGDVENALKNLNDKDFNLKYGKQKPTLETPLIFSCKSGKRAEMAAKTAVNLGYADVSSYAGSWLDWEKRSKEN